MSSKPTFVPTSSELVLKEPSLLDSRSDEEITAYIQSYRPVSSPKNVWTFWDKGWDALQGWKKRNVIDWVRCVGPDWEVRLLDAVPGSSHHISRFIPDDLLPIAIRENRMTGRFAPQHTADIIRLPLVYVHGGVWLDTGLLLFRKIDDICWNVLSNPTNPYEISGLRFNRRGVSSFLNGFIAALPQNPFILNWHRLFLHIWGDRTDASNISMDPLIAPYAYAAVDKTMGEGSSGNYMSDYLGQMLCFDRLLAIEDPVSGFSGHTYWKTRFWLLPISEMFTLHRIFDWKNGFTEEHIVKLLALTRAEPVPRDDPAQVEAELLVERSLAHSSCKKMSSGPWQNRLDTVAGQWDASEGGNGDIIPNNTWAAYLRWGSVHLKQTRETIPAEEAELSAAEGGITRRVYKVGFFEPIIPGTTPMVQGEE